MWPARHLQEHLAADRGDGRQDHDREHDRGDARSSACRRPMPVVEERDEAEVVVEPLHQPDAARHQELQAPQAVDDRGHRGEQVDDVAQRRGHPPRRVVRDEQRDAVPDRHREDHREDGGDERCRRRARRCRTPAVSAWSGNHFWYVKKLTVLTRSAGTAFQTRKTAIAGHDEQHEHAGGDRHAAEDPVARAHRAAADRRPGAGPGCRRGGLSAVGVVVISSSCVPGPDGAAPSHPTGTTGPRRRVRLVFSRWSELGRSGDRRDRGLHLGEQVDGQRRVPEAAFSCACPAELAGR